MPNKKGRLKPESGDDQRLVMRFVEMRQGTINQERSSVDVVIATENPVERYDLSRGIVVNEVLAMDGIELRAGRNQLPIVDSHDRSTVRNVLGSVRNIRVEGDELIGEASFASDEESQVAFAKLRDGHLTDFSITATPKEVKFVERGQTYKNRRGEIVSGPADIVTRWMPTDASLCATGADERSIVRRSYTDIPKGIKRAMNESLLAALVGMGMPEGLEDPDTVLSWVVGNLNAKPSVEPAATPEPIESMEDPSSEEEEPPTEEIEMADEAKPEGEEEIKKAIDRALKVEADRRKEILASCQAVGIERAFADELIDKSVPLEDARKRIINRMATNPLGESPVDAGGVRVTESGDDKFFAAAKDGLLQRAYQAAGVRRKVESPASGSSDLSNLGLRRLSERFVQRMGVNVDRMSARDIAMVAMGHPASLSRFNIQREAYHSTGSFANLMLDAANKTLLAAYDEAPYTWSIWARQASSVADFRAINRIRFSEMASPEMVPENHDYPEAAQTDAKESYRVEKYGSVFTVTWETVVNDDLDAIGRIPAMQGAACRRKQNAAVYGVLTANATMADTGALFNTTAQTTTGGHANLAGSGGAISVTTLNTAFVAMMTMKGLNSGVVLNIQPSFLIVPAAISATALQVVGSIADPAAGGSAAGNSNTLNIYGPNGGRPLRVVVDPVLDAASATSWYLAASPSQVDTVELSFLAGEESPVLENEWDFDKDVYKYKVRQTFGVAAIDYRGLFKNSGA